MGITSTEAAVREWRYGNTQAERLCADLLHLESFQDVDPQHPLGGPDGLKDVLCKRNGKNWIVAAYFPPTHPSFQEIQTKFDHDFAGVKANNAEGFAFFVNQPLTIGERQDLLSHANFVRVEIYHLERIRSLLDSPKGCGVRLQYLRIPMTEEEQLAFWSAMNYNVVQMLSESEWRRDAQMRAVDDKLDTILRRTTSIEMNLLERPSSLNSAPLIDALEMPTASFTASTLCWLHRVLTENLGFPESVRGRFRAIQVWIGPRDLAQESGRYVPPSPQDVPKKVGEWISWWHGHHRELRGRDKSEVVASLAKLHHDFLAIHPFVDANGRVARSVTDQAARELLNLSLGPEFVADSIGYYAALSAADRGDRSLLESRMMAALK
jgi:fido (protein-threonine AMPylation protein)